jgi:hypothetical protein
MKRAILGIVFLVAACGGTTPTNPIASASVAAERSPSAAPGSEAPSSVPPTSASPSAAEPTASPLPTPSPTPTAEPTPSASPVPTIAPPAADFQPMALFGSGKKVVKFTIPDGSAGIAAITYSGTKAFTVSSIAADGSVNGRVLSTTGPYKGSVLFDLVTHSAGFLVETRGAWRIVVKPTSSARTWDGVTVLKGLGDDVIQVAPPPTAQTTVGVTNAGKKRFAITAFGTDGQLVLVDQVGKFKGIVQLPAGAYIVSINANGAWVLTPR